MNFPPVPPRGAAFFALIFAALSLRGVEAEDSSARVVLNLTAGSEWSHPKWFGPLRVNLAPQIAVWLEDSQGRYVADLFVTVKAGKSAWGKVRRPEALPAWSHDRGIRYSDGLFMPTKEAPLPDAVTGPTPKLRKAGDSAALSLPFPPGLSPGSYRLLVEVNSSFDFNSAYPETRGNVNGQPSLVYSISFVWGNRPSFGTPAILGTGHPAGTEGGVRTGTEGLDSALSILDSLEIEVRR